MAGAGVSAKFCDTAMAMRQHIPIARDKAPVIKKAADTRGMIFLLLK